jgi:cobyrinic acid a,c-diamide synthase
MRHLPRVAIGSLDPDADRQPLVWGLLAALHAYGHDVAHLHSAARLSAHDATRSLTGSGSRHLDSWAMNRSTCLRTLLRASENAELSIVEGPFDQIRVPPDGSPGSTASSLNTLCDWLDLPRIAILNLDLLDPCQIPQRPQRLDGLFLDRAIDARHAAHWQTNFEALWNVPVLGWLDRAESLRSLCRTLPAGRDPSPELCSALGRRLAANLRLDRLLAIADRSPLPTLPADDLSFDLNVDSLRIAAGLRREFCGYFPDTLDLLEAAGAELCDFSPLRSSSLPDGADVVYFGCGHRATA